MDAWFGLEPLPYRIVGLALHGANAALVAAIGLRLGLTRAAAFAAAMLFGVHYAGFDALFAIGSISEPMACCLALLSLWLALPESDRPAGATRVIAVTAAFVAALLSKETVALAPFVLWLATRGRPGAARAAVIPCAIASAIFLALFYATDPVGSLRAVPGTNPYEPHWDASLLASWATYLAWAGHLVNIHEADLHDRVGRHPEAWVATALWIAALAFLVLRSRGGQRERPVHAVVVGSSAYAAFIAPVLPLATHAFHLYLYLPLAGLGWALAGAWDAWVPPKARWLAWVLAFGLVVQGAITLRGMESAPLRETHLPFMGSVRRAASARRMLAALADPSAPLPDTLLLIGPDALSPPTRPDTTALGAFLWNDIVGAVNQGTGIRLTFPQVRRVDFFGDLGPWIRTPDVGVFDYQGNVTRGPVAWLYLRRAQVEWNAGRIPTTALAMTAAEEMTKRWRIEIADGWRDEGLRAIRQQSEAMMAEEMRANRPPGDPRAGARQGFIQALARVRQVAG
ncbi:MAG: hypothetical protein E6K80_08085 [Candidatus Eisenbacteria bacterium]|uniref:Glycosyltransferase RgtA/B/C/D-like domain-containing protein n=1 Tax=Eiseniibacteriota bacterium TaxID=2212470 RepID=A0A538U3W3_UNCEI|nr:MAG: hypothetical protein E6K80_08085 [Candidatus Eisenbacteria bacterium]